VILLDNTISRRGSFERASRAMGISMARRGSLAMRFCLSIGISKSFSSEEITKARLSM
jgi:hypothetical protein